MGKNTKKIDYTKTLAATKPRKIGKSRKKPARPRMMAIQNKPVPQRGPRRIQPHPILQASQSKNYVKGVLLPVISYLKKYTKTRRLR